MRQAAASALATAPANVWTSELAYALIDNLDPERERDPGVRRAAALALAAAPETVWAPELADALISSLHPQHEKDGSVRGGVAMALAAAPEDIWTAGRAKALMENLLLDDGQWHFQEATASALAAAPGEGWTPFVAKALISGFTLTEVNQEASLAITSALAAAPASVWTPDLAKTLIAQLDPENEKEAKIREAAATAFTAAPDAVWNSDLVKALIAKLDPQSEEDSYVFGAAASALAAAPKSAWTPDLAKALISSLDWGASESSARVAVLWALVIAPENVWSLDLATTLIARLNPRYEGEPRVREAAARAFAAAPENVWSPDLAMALIASIDPQHEEDPNVRIAAADAFAAAPDTSWSPELAEALINSLDLRSNDYDALLPAATALAAMPENYWTPELATMLLRFTRPSFGADSKLVWAAWQALESAPEGLWTPKLAMFLTQSFQLSVSGQRFRDAAAEAITTTSGDVWPPELIQVLIESLIQERGAAPFTVLTNVLAAIPPSQHLELMSLYVKEQGWKSGTLVFLAGSPPLNAERLIPLLEDILRANAEEALMLRALAHVLSGGAVDTGRLLTWIGRPGSLPLDEIRGKPDVAFSDLSMLYGLDTHLDREPNLKREAHFISGQIATVACQGIAQATPAAESLLQGALVSLKTWVLEGPVGRCWSPAQAKLVSDVADWIAPSDPPRSQEIKRQLARDARAEPWRNLLWTASGWMLFWTVMLAFFPSSRQVQGIILYHPWARKYLSLGVVPILLVLVPALRRRILLPFRDDLLGEARLEDMSSFGFYGGGRARHCHAEISVVRALGQINGVVVLRGEAGLGKTSYLRWVAERSPAPVAFLHARDCREGVEEAIIRRMKNVQDVGFVRSAIHARVITVIIDGLNEVSADVREVVRSFATDNPKARIVIGMQPIEWTLPSGASVINLLRFSRKETEEFLLSRPVGSDLEQRVHGEAYAAAVANFLRLAFEEAPTTADREAAELILSNPFDLTFAADLIAQGDKVTPRGIIDRAFELADKGPGDHAYRPATNSPFPLEVFGRHALKMRLNDRNWLENGEFEAERPCLIERKLIVMRAVRVGPNETAQREIFRHERVWDFFIVAAFQKDPDLLSQHVDDARFRGAYLRIAETWPEAQARFVRDLVVESAARNDDNTTSNEFVRRLVARRTGTLDNLAMVEQ